MREKESKALTVNECFYSVPELGSDGNQVNEVKCSGDSALWWRGVRLSGDALLLTLLFYDRLLAVT